MTSLMGRVFPQSSESLHTMETSTSFDSKGLSLEVRPVSLSKVMKTAQEISYYCLHLLQTLKPALMVLKLRVVFMSMCFMHRPKQKSFYFARQTPGVLQSMRFKSLGLNKLTRQRRRRRNAGISKFCGTLCPHPRLGPKSRRLISTNRWFRNTIHSIRTISITTYFRISEWLVSRSSQWERNNCRQLHSIHNLHDAAGGRQPGCYLQPTNKNFINMLGG